MAKFESLAVRVCAYCIVALVNLIGPFAFAHDDYPPDCCNDKDCKAVSCGEIERVGDQLWRYDGVTFMANNVRSPRDGQCHVCAIGAIGRCIFFPLPPSS